MPRLAHLRGASTAFETGGVFVSRPRCASQPPADVLPRSGPTNEPQRHAGSQTGRGQGRLRECSESLTNASYLPGTVTFTSPCSSRVTSPVLCQSRCRLTSSDPHRYADATKHTKAFPQFAPPAILVTQARDQHTPRPNPTPPDTADLPPQPAILASPRDHAVANHVVCKRHRHHGAPFTATIGARAARHLNQTPHLHVPVSEDAPLSAAPAVRKPAGENAPVQQR